MEVGDGDTGWDRRLLSSKYSQAKAGLNQHSWHTFVKGNPNDRHIREARDRDLVG